MNMLAQAYDAVLLRCYETVMEKHFAILKGLGLTEAVTKEEFYGFDSSAIIGNYSSKMGEGAGIYFILRDGRVVDTSGRSHDPDPVWYNQISH
jgi:hypothetical protein